MADNIKVKFGVKVLPCPFCGSSPNVYPVNTESEGDCYGEVKCENPKCAVNPSASDNIGVNDERGCSKYVIAAIKSWNIRK